ncbi:MAG: TonB-dependent receptor plug domain-containing protein [Bacteroidales bacterium]|nr:TonB-dependent receptor plug domain-containing protein [Bacteroidales bacterium]
MKKIFLMLTCLTALSLCANAQNNEQGDDLMTVDVPRVVKKSRRWTTNPTTEITREKIEESSETSIMPLLTKNVPGLFVNEQGVAGYGVSSGGSGNISYRGFSSKKGQILVVLDGHPQYAAIYGHPMPDTYMSNNIESVSFEKGAGSVRYGSNAMGGVMNITTRSSNIWESDGSDIFQANASVGSYGTTNFSVSDEYKNGRFTLFTGANYSHSDGYRENSEYESHNGLVNASIRLIGNLRLKTVADITQFNIDMPGTVETPLLDCHADVLRANSEISLEHGKYSCGHYHWLSGFTKFYYNYGKHTINDGHKVGAPAQKYLFHSKDYLCGIDIEESLYKVITAGVNLKWYGGDAYRNPKTERYADNISFSEYAGYVMANGRFALLKDFMRIRAGVRADYHEQYGMEWIPEVDVKWRNLAFYYSKGFRTPNMREWFMYGSANPDLLPEHCNSFDLTWNLYKEKDLSFSDFELGLFYTQGDNMIETIVVDGKPKNMNSGEFSNCGVEASAEYRKASFGIQGNYSYMYQENPIVGAMRQKIGVNATFYQSKYTVNIGAQYIDKMCLATGDNEQNTSFALLDARVSCPINKWFSVFCKIEQAICSGDYETMLGYPLPKTTMLGGISLNLKQNKK